MERKRLVLDANILIRGSFGQRVRLILANHADQADFFVAQAALQSLLTVVQVVNDEWLAHARDEAPARIRDPEDWPTLALCLQLECAAWTEDQDFFGSGVDTIQ
jgi:predicted nucleic acid-binding protein